MNDDAVEQMNRIHADTLPAALGILFEVVDKERVVATMPVHPATMQPMGVLHGGASVALAETVASVGTFLNIDPTTQIAFGMEINANHLRTMTGGVVRAEAIPIHKGRTSWVWDIRIRDEDERLVCISRCTMAIAPRRT